MVKAFRSTLEEVCEADLLLHVVDYSNPNYREQIEITRSVLNDIGVKDIPEVLVYNKCDKINVKRRIKEPGIIYTSANDVKSIDEIIDRVCSELFADYRKYMLIVPYSDVRAESYFRECGNVVKAEYDNDSICIVVECDKKHLTPYNEYVVKEEKIY